MADDQTFQNYRKPTRCDEFLKTMEAIVPWAALCEVIELRRLVDIDLGREPVTDSTTITKFRKLLNDNKLGEALFAQVGQELQAPAPPAISRPTRCYQIMSCLRLSTGQSHLN